MFWHVSAIDHIESLNQVLLAWPQLGRRRNADQEQKEAQSQLPSCGLNQVCEPTGVRVDRVLLFDGPREVEVIEECQCEVKPSHCLRVPALKTYYSGTPYETVIDVGGCSGSKGSPGVWMRRLRRANRISKDKIETFEQSFLASSQWYYCDITINLRFHQLRLWALFLLDILKISAFGTSLI